MQETNIAWSLGHQCHDHKPSQLASATNQKLVSNNLDMGHVDQSTSVVVIQI